LRAYIHRGRLTKTKKAAKASQPLWLHWRVGVAFLVFIAIVATVLGLFNLMTHPQAGTPMPTPTPTTPTPTPTPTLTTTPPQGWQLSTPDPQEIFREIDSLPPYLREDARQNYEGLPVIWSVELFSATDSPNGVRIYANSANDTPASPGIIFTVDVSLYPQIKTMPTGQGFIVQGTITEVSSLWIELGDCHLIFH